MNEKQIINDFVKVIMEVRKSGINPDDKMLEELEKNNEVVL